MQSQESLHPMQSTELLQVPTETQVQNDPSPAACPAPLTVERLDEHEFGSESECHEISYSLSESSDLSASRSVTPSSSRMSITFSSSFAELVSQQSLNSTVNAALVAQIQYLELENHKLRKSASQRKYFRMEILLWTIL